MMTTSQKTYFLRYSHSIGLSTMQGRGYYYPVDTVVGADGRIYTISRSLEGDIRGVRVTITNWDADYLGTFARFGEDEAGLIWPTAIAMDSQGNFYVADEYKNIISVYDKEGNFLSSWGIEGADEGELDGPSGLALDSNDNLYVVDHHNNRIQKFTKSGHFVSSFGSEGSSDGQFSLPWGIDIDLEDHIYVADWGNDCIQKFSPDGDHIATYGASGKGDGEFHRPASVAIDQQGNIFVADWGNERVQVLDSEGSFIAKLRGEATDSRWAEDFLNINVEEAAARSRANLEPDLDFVKDDVHEESWHIEKYFWAPTSVALDNQGRLYVTESNRHRLQMYVRA